MKLVYLPNTKIKVQQEIEEDRRQRQEAFEKAVAELRAHVEQRCVDPDDNEISRFEKSVWKLLMVVGLQAVLWYMASRRQAPNSRRILGSDGRLYKYVKEKTYELRSIFGEGKYVASQYQRGEKSHQELCPLEGHVGLLPAGGLSPVLALEIVQLCTRMAYDQAREVLLAFRPYVPSTRSICGIIDMVGAQAEGVLNETTCEAGEVVVIQVDARSAPKIRPNEYEKRCKPHRKRTDKRNKKMERRRRIRHQDGVEPKKQERKRRTRGKKAKQGKRVTVGLIYALNRCEDNSWEGEYGKFFARFGAAEDVFKRLKCTLNAMGDTVKQVVFISDGDPHYRRLQLKYFADAISVIDFYHVSEYLWRAGETRFKEGSEQLEGFVSQLKEMLLAGEVEAVLSVLQSEYDAIPQRGPGTKGRRQRMLRVINYIAKRVEQMPYKQLRDQGLEIGSGAIEGAVRQIVALRFDGPGMRWGEHRPQLLLHMICLRLSGAWDRFSEIVVSRAHQAHHRRRITPIGVNEKKNKASAGKITVSNLDISQENLQLTEKAA